MVEKKTSGSHHVKLTSHPDSYGPKPPSVSWGASSLDARGPIIATTTDKGHRNAIGTHSGSYAIYRALSIAAGHLDPDHRADLTNTAPAQGIGPHESWFDKDKIVSLDPFGHLASQFKQINDFRGMDIRPSIAVTKAHIHLPEIKEALSSGRLQADGAILKDNASIVVTKAAIEPVWYLPGIAARFNILESDLRRVLFEETAGMFPELITRPDLSLFLPPIGGMTVYILGDLKAVEEQGKPLNVRVHDECNGSDVFGSDICTCRPYLVHGIEICVESAQQGGAGVVVYNRKEGRALGEVTKFLVYNARKRQQGGDSADKYFERTECVAGVQDMRFQELMPDVLHWLGIKKISKMASMSNMKFDAIVGSGIAIEERVSIPSNLIPQDAAVEIEAKKAAGYYSDDEVLNEGSLTNVKGRGLDE